MNFRSHLEIHFHDQDVGSVLLESTGGEDEQFGEVLLFCAFAARQMTNLGGGPITDSLAGLLAQVPGHLPEIASHDPEGGPHLVAYQGHKGRKGFSGDLDATERGVNFQLHLHGFGVLGRGVGYYAPTSVLLLLRYLALRRDGDARYANWLGAAAGLCGQAALDGELSGLNQIETALRCTGGAMVAIDAETGVDSEAADESATPYELDDDIVASLRAAGRGLTAEDLLDLFGPGGSSISFDRLDQSTRRAFHMVVEQQAAIFARKFPAAVPTDRREFLRDVGKGVFDGYIVVRRLLGTHRDDVTVVESPDTIEETTDQIWQMQRRIRPGMALVEAGELVSHFLSAWADHHSTVGPYGAADDPEEAAALLYVAVMNGVALALAEAMSTQGRPCPESNF